MNPTRMRWHCERITELLKTMSRIEAIGTLRAEEIERPWEQDPRPAPQPLPTGHYHP